MDAEKLKEILDLHGKYVRGEVGGTQVGGTQVGRS